MVAMSEARRLPRRGTVSLRTLASGPSASTPRTTTHSSMWQQGLQSAGRTVASRTYDAPIAAPALAHGIPPDNVNAAEFAGLPALPVGAIRHPGP